MAQQTFNGVGTHGDARAIWNANATDAESRLGAIAGGLAIDGRDSRGCRESMDLCTDGIS